MAASAHHPEPAPRMARFLVPALMVVCFGMRFFASTTVPMTYDEAMIVTASARISLQPGAVNLPMDGYGHPAGELYLARLGTVLLGHNLAGFRFVSVVLGAATCWIMFALVRRVWGFWPAALTLFLLCFNGFHIGVSRFAVEYTYLFFVALAIYLFWRAVHEERPGLLVAAGATVGVGAFTSEHTFLLLPVFAAYLLLDREKRTWYRRWQTYAGVALAILIYSPDVYWTLTHPGDLALADGASEFDVGDQISRLRPGRLSAAPLALYIPPLYYKLSERLSE
ncbi:MAG: ArnT family glycosyltransferase, partial [Armatimonadota bacterium]